MGVKTKTDTGVEFTSGGSSNIDSGKVAGNLETKYKVKDLGLTLTEKWTTDNTLNTTLDVADMDLGLSAINATAVVGHKGWLAGYQTCFDLGKSAITKNNFGLGYSASDFVLHTSVTNGTDFGGSVYQKVSPAPETGVSLGWSSASSTTSFGIGAKYVLEDGAAVRAKINNKSEIGLGYQQKLRDGVSVTL